MLLRATALSLLLAGCASAARTASSSDTQVPPPDTSVARGPCAEAYYHDAVAQMHAWAGRFEPAVAELREAIQRDPKSSVLWVQLAQWLAQLDAGGEAVAAARRAVELASDVPAPRLTLAELLRAQKRFTEAEAEVERLIAQNPKAPEP